MRRIGEVIVLVGAASLVVHGLDNTLGRTPPMGWNSWNLFGCYVSQDLIQGVADALVETGLAAAGYKYVNMDDCWQVNRTADGVIVEDPDRFPNGIAAVADYVHSKGLLFGVYSDAGELTCQKRPGSRGFEKIDAETYAKWKVDYLKYDNCYNNGEEPIPRYTAMRDALLSVDRPIYYSLCQWGVENPWRWGPSVGNSWRTSDDIDSSWLGMIRCVDDSFGLSRFAGPGHWNDMDMLEVGVTRSGVENMNFKEWKAHFAVWAAMKSPLILGLDVREADRKILDEILLKKELIAVNQDSLGVQADLVHQEGADKVIAGPLADGSRVAILWNRHTMSDSSDAARADSAKTLRVDFRWLGYTSKTKAVVRDLYLEKDLGTFEGEFSTAVQWHDVAALKITPIKSSERDTKWRPWMTNPHSFEESIPEIILE